MQTAPAIDLSTIPAAQRAAVLALMETVAALTEITRRQEHLIAELNHALHGKRSEKLTEDERQLAFEDLSIALAEVEAEKETRAAKAGDGTSKPAPKRTIGNLPAGLPRIEEVIEPDSLICPCGCGVMHKIGEDRSERLDIVPAQLRVIVTVRPKYACRDLHRRRDPSPCAQPSDHGRSADRGDARPCAGQQICGPPAVVSPEPDPGAGGP
jgi:transposase